MKFVWVEREERRALSLDSLSPHTNTHTHKQTPHIHTFHRDNETNI